MRRYDDLLARHDTERKEEKQLRDAQDMQRILDQKKERDKYNAGCLSVSTQASLWAGKELKVIVKVSNNLPQPFVTLT
jgi:hypothetical protein